MSATAPLAITNLTASVSGQSVNLSWNDPNSPGAGTEIWRTIATGEDSNFVLLSTIPSGTTSYQDTIPFGQTLYYRAVALPMSSRAFVPAAPSNVVVAKTTGQPPHKFAQLLTVDGSGNFAQICNLVTDGSWTAGARG